MIKKKKKEWRGIWDEESRKNFVQRLEKCERRRNEGIEEQWRGMEERLKRILRKVGEKREEEIKVGRKMGWWDKDYRKEKRE